MYVLSRRLPAYSSDIQSELTVKVREDLTVDEQRDRAKMIKELGPLASAWEKYNDLRKVRRALGDLLRASWLTIRKHLPRRLNSTTRIHRFRKCSKPSMSA
jgi:hypothetical protein